MAKKRAPKEQIYRQGLGDPRTGPERIAGLVNRAAQGSPAVRRYDDSPADMAKNLKKSAKKKKK
jgi:hypothetical protein